MELSIDIVREAFRRVVENEDTKEENRIFFKELLASDDRDKQKQVYLDNIQFFFDDPSFKEVYLLPEVVKACIDKFNHSIGEYRSIYVQIFFERTQDEIDYKAFLNTSEMTEELLKNDVLFRLFYRNFKGFFECFDGILKKQMEDKFFDSLDVTGLSIYTLNILSEELIDLCLQNAKFREIIYNELSKGYFFNLDEKVAYKLWGAFKDDITRWPLDKQVKLIGKLPKELALEALEMFQIIDNIDNINSFDLKDIAEIIPQSVFYQKCIEYIEIGKERQFGDYLKLLNKEMQKKLINYLIDNKKSRLILEYKDWDNDLLEQLFVMNPNFFPIDFIYQIYLKSKNPQYLVELKNRLLNMEEIDLKSFLNLKSFTRLLSDDERQILASKIVFTSASVFSHVFLNEIEDDYDPFFLKIYMQKCKEFMLQNPNYKLYLSTDFFFNYLSKKEQTFFINYIDSKRFFEHLLSDEKLFNFMVDYLKEHPDFFRTRELSPFSSFTESDALLDRIDEILPYFDNSQLILFADSNIININEKIRNYILEYVFLHPDMMKAKLISYYSYDDLRTLLSKMSVETFKNLIKNLYEKSPEIVYETLKAKKNDFIEFWNNDYFGFDNEKIIKIYLECLSSSEIDDMISRITNLSTLEVFFFESLKAHNDEASKSAIDKLLGLYVDSSIKNEWFKFRLNLSKYNQEQVQYIIGNVDFKTLFFISKDYFNQTIKNKLMEYLKKDISCLIDNDIAENISNFIYLLHDEDRNFIESKVDGLLASNQLYSKFKNKIKGITLKEKLKFLCLCRDALLSQKKIDTFEMLLDENPFVLSTINPILFNDQIIEMDDHFLIKTSKYQIVQRNLVELSKIHPEFLNLLVRLSDYIKSQKTTEFVYDLEISSVIEFLSKNNKLKEYDFAHADIRDILNYILYNYQREDTFKEYGSSVENFSQERIKKCDEEFAKSTNIDDMKNIYCYKYLSMSLKDIVAFNKKYVINYDKVQKYAKNDVPLQFISLLTKILSISDVVTLKELYNKTTIYYDKADLYTIESIMQSAYFDSLVHDYHDKQNGVSITKEFKDLDGNMRSIPMIELSEDFGIFVHSTCAYGSMQIIDDDYFLSWNNNPSTENHGICTSYITNSSYGTAAVTDKGVMFAFTRINNQSIATYSPYDLATSNRGYNIVSSYNPFYTTLDNIPRFTRHTHNEFDFERRNHSIDPRFDCIQPDAIVIYEDMDESIKANSIKAYEDFKKHGVELKIYYIDRVKIANNEASKLKNMMMQYRNTFDMNELALIIDKYESNICGCDFIQGIDKDALFMTDDVRALLRDTVTYLINLTDKDMQRKQVNAFIQIINNEQYKFDLLDDRNKKRAKKFNLSDDELKAQITYLKSLIGNQETVIQK